MMCAEARAIATIAHEAGNVTLAALFNKRADEMLAMYLGKCM
jgi:hypothetical protein